jgi:adenine-specific DNA-methyltransferase
MARKRKSKQKEIEQYDHKDEERVNNPPVGLVTSETDKEGVQRELHEFGDRVLSKL